MTARDLLADAAIPALFAGHTSEDSPALTFALSASESGRTRATSRVAASAVLLNARELEIIASALDEDGPARSADWLQRGSTHAREARVSVVLEGGARGVPVEWWSRVGDDPFGDRIIADLTAHGVHCADVTHDQSRPTGVYFKERHGHSTEVHYYRAGSAASAMSLDDLDGLRLHERRLLHLTGITPALSPSCDQLVEQMLRAPRNNTVSFDVNHRPALWPDVPTAAGRLEVLANLADIVLIGRDEGERLWGCKDASEIRAVLPSPRVLIVKNADVEAVAFVASPHGTDTVHRVPALTVEVVEPVGAGDAFAAGYLAGWLAGESPRVSLRTGHVLAAHALLSTADVAPALQAREVDRLRHLDDEQWGALRLPLDDAHEKATT